MIDLKKKTNNKYNWEVEVTVYWDEDIAYNERRRYIKYDNALKFFNEKMCKFATGETEEGNKFKMVVDSGETFVAAYFYDTDRDHYDGIETLFDKIELTKIN